MNNVALMGYLGTNPTIRYTSNKGMAVANFRLATNQTTTDKTTGEVKKHTTWHSIVAWGRLAEACAKALKKGSKVLVDGRIETREYQPKDGLKRTVVKVRADTVNFLDRPDKKPAEGHSNEAYAAKEQELEAA